MPREKIKLTVESHGSKIRYKKMFKGVLWHSNVFESDSRENKSAAWKEFVAWRSEAPATKKQKLSSNVLVQAIQNQLIPLIQHAELTGDSERANKLLQISKKAPTMDAEERHIWLAYFFGEVNGVDHKLMFKDRAETVKRLQADTLAEFECGKLVAAHIKSLQLKAKTGRRSHGNVGKIKTSLEMFCKWYGPSRSMQNLTEKSVRDYTEHLEILVSENKIAASTASGYQSEFRTWVTQLIEEYPNDIPLPRNLRSKAQRIIGIRKEPITFSLAEITLLLDHATPRTRLFLLLMLNCGYYQSDISDLKASEIEWLEGRIIRPRSKIRHKESAEARKVNFKLWPETWRLFTKFANREGRCFLTERGNPFVEYSDSGNGSRNDLIKSAYRRLIDKLKRNKKLPKEWNKSLKMFRKTSTNLLEKSQEHGDSYSMYLNSSVAKNHYLRSGEPVPNFDAAIEWLGKQILSD